MATTGVEMYDELISTDGDELWDRLGQAHRRFAAILSVTPGATVLDESGRTASDVAARMLTLLRSYTRNTSGGHVEGLSVSQTLDQVWQELHCLEEQRPRCQDLHRTYPFGGGVSVDGAAALGHLIGEFLVHGRDVARSRGKTWQIGARNAALALNVVAQSRTAPIAGSRRADLTVWIKTPETNAWVLRLADDVVVSRRAERGDRADVRIFARTEPLLLSLHGRIGSTQATASGIAVVGGLRPWRVTRMSRAFFSS